MREQRCFCASPLRLATRSLSPKTCNPLVFTEVLRTCAPHARMVFTYQSLNGRGWRALAEAMGAAGIVPISGWPMFGGGNNLHKRANSISWDCVLHCAVHQSPRAPIFDEFAMSAGATFSKRWRVELAGRGRTPSHGDLENLRHAGSVINALNQKFAGRTAS